MARRKKILIEYNGKKQSYAEWSRDTGLAAATITDRIEVMGMTPEKALTLPPDIGKTKLVTAGSSGEGRQLQIGIVQSYKKVWEECGRDEFERQLAESFKTSAVKTVEVMQKFLPHTHPEDNLPSAPMNCIQINNVLSDADAKHFIPLGGQ